LKHLWYRIFLIVSLFLLIFYQTIITDAQQSMTKTTEFTKKNLAILLFERLKQFKLETPSNTYEEISVLPGFPEAVYHVIGNYERNGTPIYVFSSISSYGKVLVSFKQLSRETKEYDLESVLTDALSVEYKESLELFYTLIPSMATGIPNGFYDVAKPVGFKELDIPQYPEIKFKLKPKLLAVFIGFSDGETVRGPIYIYYYGFETTGITYDGTYTRVTIVASIVVDNANTLYSELRALTGIVFYYSTHSVAPISGSFPITTVYGFLGILAALVVSFIEYDEDYKFYLTIFIIFALQIFLYIALNALAGITPDILYGSVIALGPWFVALFLLWIAPYVFATFQYYSRKEEPLHTSQGLAIFEGIGMALSILFIAFSIVFTRKIVDYIVTVSGPGGIYGFITIIIIVDMYIGFALGRLWAVFSRYHEIFTGPSYR